MIYMPLVAEGTDCWRPVQAVQISDDVFEVTGHIPAGESWAFGPNSRVRCRSHVFINGESGLAAFEYAVERDPNYQLLSKHEREVFRIRFADGEEAVVKVLHVDGRNEDFVYDLISSNSDSNHYRDRARKANAYVAKFTDLVSVQPEG